jgi:hypothetical protein
MQASRIPFGYWTNLPELVKSAVLILAIISLGAVLLVPVGANAQNDDAVKFHNHQRSPKVDYAALLEKATPLDDSPEGRQLLSDCLVTYGGVENLEKLMSFQVTYAFAGSGDANKVAFVKSFRSDRRYKVVEGDKERILNGENCWVQNAEKTWKMDDFRYRAELYSYLVLGMPLAAERENFEEIRFSDNKEDDHGLFYFTKTDSMMIIMSVDKTEHFINSTTGILPDDSNQIVFMNKFDDFRKVEGFVFPHKWVNYSLGMKMGEYVLDAISVNPDIPDAEFLPRFEAE